MNFIHTNFRDGNIFFSIQIIWLENKELTMHIYITPNSACGAKRHGVQSETKETKEELY